MTARLGAKQRQVILTLFHGGEVALASRYDWPDQAPSWRAWLGDHTCACCGQPVVDQTLDPAVLFSLWQRGLLDETPSRDTRVDGLKVYGKLTDRGLQAALVLLAESTCPTANPR